MAPKQSNSDSCQSLGSYFKWTLATIALCTVLHCANAEYENTWNFYYEQPCCANANGHHIRHHRGKFYKYILLHHALFIHHI